MKLNSIRNRNAKNEMKGLIPWSEFLESFIPGEMKIKNGQSFDHSNEEKNKNANGFTCNHGHRT